MEENRSGYTDDFTLRDLVLKIRSWIREVLRYWYIPALFVVLGVGIQLFRYFTFEPVYPARITFSVDEDEGGNAGGITGILGQFGLGSVRPSRFNLDKILALSKSRRVISNTLFARVSIDGTEDYIANHILREYDWNKTGSAGENERPFYFTHDSLPAFNRQENEMLIALYGFVIGPPEQPKKALMTADYNEDTNIMSIDVVTSNEGLSLELAQRMFTSLSAYYVNKAIEKQLKTYTIITHKRDSVLAVLKSAEYQLANFRDTHRGLVMRTDQLSEIRLQREITALGAMYAEVLKNTEVADFSLRNKTPFIQVIDSPLSPIAPTEKSLPRTLLIGILIGGFIGCVLVVGRRVFHDVMHGPDQRS